MTKSIYKGKTIRISEECFDLLKDNINPMFKMAKYVEEAIKEKIAKDTTEKVQYRKDFKK